MLAVVGERDGEQASHQERHVSAHEHEAAVHDEAVVVHEVAATFFEEHGKPDKAKHEQALADDEAAKAAAARATAQEPVDP